MLIKDIVRRINKLMADELYSYDQMIPHLDRVVDDINDRLDACYPVFSELALGTTAYAYFPDKYIRQVVIPGTAYNLYLTDEEGVPTAAAYGQMYANGLFHMERDYISQVPLLYENPDYTGKVPFHLTGADDDGLIISEMRP